MDRSRKPGNNSANVQRQRCSWSYQGLKVWLCLHKQLCAIIRNWICKPRSETNEREIINLNEKLTYHAFLAALAKQFEMSNRVTTFTRTGLYQRFGTFNRYVTTEPAVLLLATYTNVQQYYSFELFRSYL